MIREKRRTDRRVQRSAGENDVRRGCRRPAKTVPVDLNAVLGNLRDIPEGDETIRIRVDDVKLVPLAVIRKTRRSEVQHMKQVPRGLSRSRRRCARRLLPTSTSSRR